MIARVVIHVDDVTRKILRLKEVDLRGAFSALKRPARLDQRDHKKKRLGSDGPWPARSSLTSAKLGQKSRKRPRKLLGRLPSALEMLSSRKSLIVRSRVSWSKAHQEGRRVGHGAKLPAREFLWASGALMKTVAEYVEVALAKWWDRM